MLCLVSLHRQCTDGDVISHSLVESLSEEARLGMLVIDAVASGRVLWSVALLSHSRNAVLRAGVLFYLSARGAADPFKSRKHTLVLGCKSARFSGVLLLELMFSVMRDETSRTYRGRSLAQGESSLHI